MEINKKSKKSAKKHKSKDRNSVPLMLSRSSEVIHSEQFIPPPPALPLSPPAGNQERPLSPDSALASSESSGSSLRKQGKNQGKFSLNRTSNNGQLVQIVTYQQFQPVLRKSANIQEKIAIFSKQTSGSARCTSLTTGKTFPTLRQHGSNKVFCLGIECGIVFILGSKYKIIYLNNFTFKIKV